MEVVGAAKGVTHAAARLRGLSGRARLTLAEVQLMNAIARHPPLPLDARPKALLSNSHWHGMHCVVSAPASGVAA